MKVAIIEVRQVVVGEMELPGDRITDPDVALEIFRYLFAEKDREHFITLLLNTKNIIVGVHTVSIGSLNAAIVHPREVFKAAILRNAAGLICAHNHPSGNPDPSPEDNQLTNRLVECAKLMGIELLDHLIIGSGEAYYSYREEGVF